MIPLGVYVRHNQPEEYRNWVTILMQNGYPVPRWKEWGGTSVVKESFTIGQRMAEVGKDFTRFQRMLDKLMRMKPRYKEARM